MARHIVIAWVVLAAYASVCPAYADFQSDRTNCSASVRANSAEACGRLIASGSVSRSDRFMAYYNRAWSYRRADANELALEDLNKAAPLNPGFASLYLTRAEVEEDLGKFSDARTDLDRYIALAPNDWRGYYRRAALSRRTNAPKAALADLAKALELNPYEKLLVPLRVLVLSDVGNNAAAIIEADRLVAARRSDPAGRYARAVVLLRLGKRQAAEADLDAVLQVSPLFSAAHALRGELAEARGDSEAAKVSYRLAMRVGGPETDARSAREKASTRLAALGAGHKAGAPLPERSIEPAQPQAETVVSGKGECRRFIPSAATIIRVACK